MLQTSILRASIVNTGMLQYIPGVLRASILHANTLHDFSYVIIVVLAVVQHSHAHVFLVAHLARCIFAKF